MGSEIDDEYIYLAIDDLISYLGVKENIASEVITNPLRSGNIKECIQNIANYLGLPISVNLLINNTFTSKQLSKTNRAGRGIEGIIAQVHVPSYVPAFGTPGLQNFPITVQVSENCAERPETFAVIIAHELSHILLHSLLHKEKDNEIYVDLVVILLGFSRFMKTGRKVVSVENSPFTTKTMTTTYGYLSDDLFNFAYHRVNSILNDNINSKRQLVKKFGHYRKQVSSYKRKVTGFNRYMEYIDTQKKEEFKKEDIPQIIEFHQPSYADRLNAVMRTHEERLRRIMVFCGNLIHYTPGNMSLLSKFEEEIDSSMTHLNSDASLLTSNIYTLRKYINFFRRIILNS